LIADQPLLESAANAGIFKDKSTKFIRHLPFLEDAS
jgi:hypothetical protein